MESCTKHPHMLGAGICRRCGDTWCRECLVYSFGPKKPPYCMSCAMVVGGVRTTGARPAMAKRDVRARAKAARLEAKASKRATRQDTGASTLEPAVMADTDWSTPWWEDRQPTLAD